MFLGVLTYVTFMWRNVAHGSVVDTPPVMPWSGQSPFAQAFAQASPQASASGRRLVIQTVR